MLLLLLLRPQRVGFSRRFSLKKRIHFARFGQQTLMVFKGTMEVYARWYLLFQLQMSKKEREILICSSKWILKNLFCYCSNLSNGDIISYVKGQV